TLLGELEARTAAYGLYGRPAAQGAGRRLAGARGLGDRLLERNQALRTAVLEVQHVVTLLGYLAALAEARQDAALGAWLRGWEGRLRGLEDRARTAVAAQASDPAGAIRPADPGPAGRAGQKLNAAIGSLGEAIDAAA